VEIISDGSMQATTFGAAIAIAIAISMAATRPPVLLVNFVLQTFDLPQFADDVCS
jgi:hypothetical protein